VDLTKCLHVLWKSTELTCVHSQTFAERRTSDFPPPFVLAGRYFLTTSLQRIAVVLSKLPQNNSYHILTDQGKVTTPAASGKAARLAYQSSAAEI
jgi:hypothetical protein